MTQTEDQDLNVVAFNISEICSAAILGGDHGWEDMTPEQMSEFLDKIRQRVTQQPTAGSLYQKKGTAFSEALALDSVTDCMRRAYDPIRSVYNGVTQDDLIDFARLIAYKVAHNLHDGYKMDALTDPLDYTNCPVPYGVTGETVSANEDQADVDETAYLLHTRTDDAAKDPHVLDPVDNISNNGRRLLESVDRINRGEVIERDLVEVEGDEGDVDADFVPSTVARPSAELMELASTVRNEVCLTMSWLEKAQYALPDGKNAFLTLAGTIESAERTRTPPATGVARGYTCATSLYRILEGSLQAFSKSPTDKYAGFLKLLEGIEK